MKKVFLVFNVALCAIMLSVFVSCSKEHVYSIDEFFKSAESLVNDTVTLQGLCTHLCSHGGRKAFLRGEAEKPVLRINSGKNFDRFAPECINNTIKVKGVIRAIDIAPVVQDSTQTGEEEHGGCETEKKASRNYYVEGISYEIIKKR